MNVELQEGIAPDAGLSHTMSERLQSGTGAAVKVEFIEQIPRTGGKTKRVRPLSERGQGDGKT